MAMNFDVAEYYLSKWQEKLRLRDWDIKLHLVKKEWRKTGDIKIDIDDRNAVLLINTVNPKQTNLEEVIIHELLHLKLFGMDQMIEGLLSSVYGNDSEDTKQKLAYGQFMTLLESTVNDLAKSFLLEGGEDKDVSFGRLAKEIEDEIGIQQTTEPA
ncbi:MAG: DUF3849 domain-containing protein [Oscillospiraceae bacterium]|jgi:hypothetical protein|nr:DUF3849 domain-containing protein [Oscillospiraceae bacterium]